MMTAWLEKAVGTDPSKTAVVYGDERIRYDELLSRVDRCAAGLRKSGVGEGDCVAVVLHNCPEFIVTFFAVAALKAIVLPLNPLYTKEELRRFLADAKPRVIVSGGPAIPVLLALAAERDGAHQVVSVGRPAPGTIPWSTMVSANPVSSVRGTHAGRVLYLYTSGSTDSYKRVCCTQENLYWEARNFVETAGLSAADTILCTIPLFHSYGIGNCLLDAAYLGATLVLLPPEPDGADPPFANRCHRVAELFRAEQVAFYPGVPYQFSVLASLPPEFLIDLSSARLFVSSGDALPASTYARFLRRFGKPVRSLYGSTEAGSIAINMDPDAQVEYGSVGMPVRRVAIEIRDADGNELPAGADGEIWVGSPTIPPTGYDNRSDISHAVFRAGSYSTGDIGHKNHRGQLFLAGRKQSFINIAGYKVDTSEIEEVLESCPGLREAAVIGVDVPRMGIVIKAAVVTEGPFLKSEIRAFCRQRLAFYKVPRLIEAYTALPRSAVGKVLKSELGGVEEYLKEIRGADAAHLAAQLPMASPGRRRGLTASLVHAQVAAVLARPIAAVPRDAGFTELGMDSFASIELLARLEYVFDLELPQTFTFDHPTIDAVTARLIEYVGIRHCFRRADRKDPTMNRSEQVLEPIAVVGMACRFPGGSTPDEFWDFLARGGDAIREIPPERWDVDAYYDPDPGAKGKMYTRFGAFIPDFDHFSPGFFGISPREAQFMDPQQRQLLEVHWEALENAGIVPQRLSQQQVGVFVGMGTTDYGDLQAALGPSASDAYNGTGGSHAAAAGRLSYLLGVRGPSLAVDTACSSSLVSVHLAMMSLRSGESNIAVASGVNLNFAPDVFISLCKARMLSPDGHCKTFDASANGYVRGEGCGVLVLKRLADAQAAGDNVLALLRGSGTNHNGQSSGLTVPSGPAQQEVIRTALRNAGVDPSEIGFLEAHGTGTAVGDPIEAGALGAVFAGRPSPLLVGSVKTNCGHLEWAAGICGLIKVILSMHRGVIPPNLHLRHPNPMIPWETLPIRIVTEATPWPEGTRIAGVSSFGFGGTNAHVIVEQAPSVSYVPPAVDRPMHVLTLSAKSDAALRQLADRVAEAANQPVRPPLPDLCFSANTGRSTFEHRLATVAASNQELAVSLRSFAGRVATPKVKSGRAAATPPMLGMLFTGQGSQLPGMGRELYGTQPVFRRALERCDALLRGLLAKPLLDVLYFERDGGERFIDQTAYTQPALFAIEYALAQLWESWGVIPDVVLGHSVGEYVAACHAGWFELEDGLRLIAARGRLMQALPPNGAMLAIKAGEDRIAPLIEPLRDRVSIAAVNGPNDVVISGVVAAVESIAGALRDRGVQCQRLNVSHAFHSPLMEPMLQEFAAVAAMIPFRSPRLRLISNVTGREAGEEIADPSYWVRHVRQEVRFADSIRSAAEIGCEIFVEAGPQPVLCALGRQCLGSGSQLWLPSLHSKRGNWEQILDSTAELSVRGVDIDWQGLDRDYSRRKVALPTYPFERQRYWFPSSGGALVKGSGARPLVDTVSRSPMVKETLFSVSLGVASQPYLADHKVHGQIVVPGAAYLAMLISGAELLEWTSCRIEDVYFLAPLVLAGGQGRTVQAVLTPVEESASQTVQIGALSSGAPGEAMVQLMSGRISPGAPPSATRVDLQALQSACPESYDPEKLYEVIDSAGVQVKESFRWVEQLWRGKGVALAKLRLPDAVGALDGYRLHPALLDAGFQVAGAILGDEEQNETLLPFSVKTLRQERPATGTAWWCHATRTGATTWDIQFLDSAGESIVALDGFEMRKAPASVFLRRRLSDWLYRLDWKPQPLAEQAETAASGSGTWLVLDNGSQLGSEVARRLVSRGNRVVLASERTQATATSITIDPSEPADFRGLLERCGQADGSPLRGIMHLWGGGHSGSVDEPARRAEQLAIGFLHLAQAVAAGATHVPLYAVTRSAQLVRSGENVNPEQAPLWGIQRGLMLEAPELRVTCIDTCIDTDADAVTAASALIAELNMAPGDAQVSYRGDERHVARLVRYSDAVPQEIDGPFRLQLKDYGSPDNLQLAPMTRQKPARNQVEIAVKATALNFRDVVIALGMLKDFYAREMKIEKASDIWLGFDCAGVISAVGEGVTDLAVGDEVMSPAVGGAASHIIAYREAVMRVPKGLDPMTAASLPTVFWTAYHSLVQLARLKAGERVLIHAAAGGVGLAAIQIAKAAGAEIFATASPGKWDYLRSQGIVHIMNSRTLDFADEILRETGGAGVDVVLNSLTGAVVERSFSVLKQGGRFVEIGRLGGGIPAEAERRPDAVYFTFELGSVIARDPVVSIRTGEEICRLFEDGVAQPLPLTTYSIDNAAEAYRFIQQTKHIGKVVLTLGETPSVRGDSSYLVTGGLGGLGLKVAEFLASSGARHLVLAGRSGASPETEAALQALRRDGTSITVVQGDVAKRDDVAAMIEACHSVAPLRGVIHAAGLLREALFRKQNAQTYADAMAPKAHGAWELHRQTRTMPLDFFVCFSSMASLAGSPGQTNYCAANAFLDGLANFRRTQGLPAMSIGWGPWADVGMAAGLELGAGIEKLSSDDGISALRALLKPQRGSEAQVGVMKIRWDAYIKRWPSPAARQFYSALLDHSRGAALSSKDDFLKIFRSTAASDRQQLVEAHIHDAVRQVLGLTATQEIKNNEAWTDLGVDSLMMVEIKNRLEASLRVTFPIELLMRDVSIHSVGEFVLSKLPDTAEEDSAPAHAQEPEDSLALRFEIRESMHAIPQAFAAAEDERARQVLIGGRWRCDFASCNYLGFDLEPEIMAAIPEAVTRWGTHPSWTRAVASPSLYGELERELATTLGASETLVFPSISLLHLGVLPALAGYNGAIFTDAAAHHSMMEACMRARADGTEWVEFRHNDLADLESKLAKCPSATTKIIATDGVYSMGSPNPPLVEYSRLAKQYNATVYVDDAHGFGIVGANPDESLPYGYGGVGIVRHLGLDYGRDRIIYVAGLSKAFSSYAAFLTCQDEKMKMMLQTTGPYVFSGPTAVACLATALAGLRLNRRDGDARRLQIHRLTKRLVREASSIGFEVDNDSEFPIVGVVMGGWDAMVTGCQVLWEHDILITPATFPAVPANRNLVRFSITSANTDEELDQAVIALRAVWASLHSASEARPTAEAAGTLLV